MKSGRLAAAAVLTLAGAALVATPAQASTSSYPSCTYTLRHKAGPSRDILTWKVTNVGSWVTTGVVFVHLTDLNVDKRFGKAINPTTHKVSLNLTNKTGGHPYTLQMVQLNGSHVPDDGEHFGASCAPA